MRLADAFGVDRRRAAETVAWPPALVLWAQRTLRGAADGLPGGGAALRALERKLARCCAADGDAPLPPRATPRDAARALELAALYGLRAEDYGADDSSAQRYLRCRRVAGCAPPVPLLSDHAVSAPTPARNQRRRGRFATSRPSRDVHRRKMLSSDDFRTIATLSRSPAAASTAPACSEPWPASFVH